MAPVTEIRALLEGQRVLSLGVLVDGAPWVGLLPYALSNRRESAFIHASRLARHTAGLLSGAPFSALIHAPDPADGDPLQVPRLTLCGVVEPLLRGSGAYGDAQSAYLGRFPGSEVTFGLGDFGLYRLVFRSARYIGGFARAFDVDPAGFASREG